MAAGNPAWPRVEAILRPYLHNGQLALLLWPVCGKDESETSSNLIAATISQSLAAIERTKNQKNKQ